jgi:hypothetical protein
MGGGIIYGARRYLILRVERGEILVECMTYCSRDGRSSTGDVDIDVGHRSGRLLCGNIAAILFSREIDGLVFHLEFVFSYYMFLWKIVLDS